MLKLGFRVQGKTNFTKSKQGVILREIGEGRKRKWEVQWDDQSTDVVSTRSIRQITEPAVQNQQINATTSEIRSPILNDVDGVNSTESDDDSLYDVERDRTAENEVEPDAYLEAPLLT
jgi:hypothetical protein